MQRMMRATLLLIGFLMFSFQGHAQRKLVLNDYMPDGYIPYFEIGVAKNESINSGQILITPYLSNFFVPINKFSLPHLTYDSLNRMTSEEITRYIADTSGHFFRRDSEVKRKQKNEANFFTHGHVKLSKLKRINSLRFQTWSGIPNFTDVNKLQQLIINEASSGIGIETSRYKEKPYGIAQMILGSTFGNPFLVAEISKLKQLNYLYIRNNYYNISGYSDYTFIDIPYEIWLRSKYLTTFRIALGEFLPVDFNLYRQLEYFEVGRGCGPELLNLALVFQHFGADSSENRIMDILEFVQVPEVLIIPENGTFETFYKDGSPLCKGNFQQGQPHGKWQFFYEKGELAQQRYYKHGIKTGDWLMLAQPKEWLDEQDTLILRNYKEDLLMSEKRSEQNYLYDCVSREESVIVNKKAILKMNRINQDSIQIIHNIYYIVSSSDRSFNKGDTLFKEDKLWNGGPNEWSFAQMAACFDEKNDYSKFYNGYFGEPPYRYKSIRRYNYKSANSLNGYTKTYTEDTNLRDGYYVETVKDSRGLPIPSNVLDSVFVNLPKEWRWLKP